MKELAGINNSSYYFDMKNGIREEKMEEEEQYREYWTNILNNIGFTDSEFVLEGVGPNLLKKIFSFMEKNISRRSFFRKVCE